MLTETDEQLGTRAPRLAMATLAALANAHYAAGEREAAKAEVHYSTARALLFDAHERCRVEGKDWHEYLVKHDISGADLIACGFTVQLR